MNYTEEFTRKVLASVKIQDVISKYTSLVNVGGVLVGNCPLHKDKSESMIVNPEKQVFHCFDCGKNGNAAVFLMEKKGISFGDAVKELSAMAHIIPTEQDIAKPNNEVFKSNLRAIHKDAAIFYRNQLSSKEGVIAMQYLKDREISEESMKTFYLGYAPSKGNALYKYLKQKGYDDDLMLKAGLIKISETGPYDMFRGRVMFPIMDEQRRVIAFGGRVINPEHKPKYLNSPESAIFNKSTTLYGIHDTHGFKGNYFILCEGNVDVIRLHQEGFKNAVATLGTAFTPAHIPVIKNRTQGLVLSFDADEAGQKAAVRTIKTLDGSGLGVRVLSMQPYKDPDEFIKALGPDEYKSRIMRSMGQIDFQLKHMATQYDLSNSEQKHEYLTRAVEMLMEKQERQIDTQTIERQ